MEERPLKTKQLKNPPTIKIARNSFFPNNFQFIFFTVFNSLANEGLLLVVVVSRNASAPCQSDNFGLNFGELIGTVDRSLEARVSFVEC